MPLSSRQLADLVERARQKAPPVVSPPPPPPASPRRSERPRQVAPVAQLPAATRPPPPSTPKTPTLRPKVAAAAPTAPLPPLPSPAPQSEEAAVADFPVGWQLSEEVLVPPSSLLRRDSPADGAGRILAPAQADPAP